MLAEPIIRESTDADLLGILEVLKASLGETPILRRTPELFTWKHRDNPFGPSIILVAVLDDRIVGVRAFMRWELETPDGSKLQCVRAVDTATHPHYARRGIFRSLTETALEVAAEDGVDMVFNTPNARSGAGYLSMGWQEVGWVGAMVRPRVGRSLAPVDGAPPDIESALPDAKVFKSVDPAARPAIGLRTSRTKDYYDWRFASHPTARYALVAAGEHAGAIVRPAVRSGRSEVLISEVFGDDMRAAIDETVAMHRCRYAAAWFSPGTPERKACLAAGLLPVPGLRTMRLVARPLRDLGLGIFNLDTWDLAVSDLELL